MALLTDLQSQLRAFPCHFMWELEKKSIKQFGSLMKLIDEHISDSPAMVIEGLLFKSYLFFSEFRGNAEKKKARAMECIDEVRRKIREEDPSKQPSNNGYLLIAITLEAWFDRRDKKRLESNIRELRKLNSLYEDGSPEHNMFKGSIHATKGFALSRVGMNRYSESIKEFETALELCPGEKDWLFSVGLVRWRLAKAAVKNRHEFCPDMTTVLSIFYDVLKMDSEHSLALVYIAEIRRRKKNIHKAKQFLKNALRKHPVRQKVLGEAIGVYRKMACFDEAIRVINIAEQLEEPSSFIYHQAYLVYRDISAPRHRDQYSPPNIDYLQKAIDTNPSNLAAKFDRAKELIYARKYDEATEYYNQLFENFEDDPESVIRINSQFALFLQKQKKQNEAIDKHQMVIDVALEEFLEDRGPP
ncbi:interferon-induced protein with tetratricopeptide repeats 5-like, partial [Antedon mediterranea]|uniref:interferon-induced protein with tetratricopeptide repeats 5-like n=1 Tax=Antedon mediterranea TaxID=105859 RepID=UPI003AF519C8